MLYKTGTKPVQKKIGAFERMRLGVVLLWCLFILCVSGVAAKPLSRLGLRASSCAALSLLLLAASALHISPIAELSINPAAVLLLIATGFATRSCSAVKLLWAVLLALPASLCMELLLRYYAGRIAAFPEPGLLTAFIGLLFALPLLRFPAAALFLAALAPFLLSLWEAALDLYAFGYAVVAFGSPTAFDTQVCCLFLTAMAVWLLGIRKKAARQV